MPAIAGVLAWDVATGYGRVSTGRVATVLPALGLAVHAVAAPLERRAKNR